MSRSGKIWLGVFTFLPFICLLLIFILHFGALFISFTEYGDDFINPDGSFSNWLIVLLLAIIFFALSSLAVLIYYIVHAVRNSKLNDTLKLIWIIVFFFASGIGPIIYYFVEILSSGRETSD